MRASFLRMLTVAVLAVFAAAAPTRALPRSGSEALPLSAADEQSLFARLGAARFEALLALLARTFYPDAANTPTAARQVFYTAPYFTPDPQAGVIGEQIIDVDALALLDAFDALLAQLSVSPILLSRLEIVAREHEKASKRVLLTLGTGARTQPISRWALEVNALTSKLSGGLAVLAEADRKQLTAELSPIGERVAVPRPTTTLPTPDELLAFLTKIRAALANRSYGVRRATFIAGLTKAEAELFSAYLDLRPDVALKTLPVPQFFVSAVSQSTSQLGVLDDRVLGVELIRSVNQATSGKCENQNTCTVVLEFTELGARTALLSVFGASLMPVIFSGDVVYSDTSPLIATGGSRGAPLDVQKVARDTGLNEVLLDQVQIAPSASSVQTLSLRTSALLDTSEVVARARVTKLPLERTLEPTGRGEKGERIARATRVFFDGFPLVCFEGQPKKPWRTKLRACSDPLLEIGTQVSRYEEVVDAYCGDERIQRCLERVAELPFDQTEGGLLELPMLKQLETSR